MFQSAPRPWRPAPALVVLGALALGACSAVSTTQVRGYMVSETQLEQIPVGSSQEQVQIVLGTPSTTATIDGQVFYYISSTEKRTMRFMKAQTVDRRVLAIYFDRDRRVSRIANYGLQDGVVFDFISRSTPTSGVEKNFVSQLLGLLSF
ncbi:outer membrane protein assembly factor BamE [Terrihabitans rhizophilus]|uniref:Outer membrane protein assembly factor BamE n=1 Tax=Terrihabitans rhizophilus TaxID=3092662 RepID=A0ABU4RSD4_9HYPH|nr:outer membrane protein assembly factor BamE [Terrihabitans sp. PJ23]MDX6807103.1 outer membrane protein assembly factor BamE [Terrihabitans sp. PJ23]